MRSRRACGESGALRVDKGSELPFCSIEVTAMRPSRLRLTVRWLRWLMFAAAIVGMDLAAIYWVVEAKTSIIGGLGGGPWTAHWMSYSMYDGSGGMIVHNYVTGKTTTTVGRPATPEGL